MLARTSALACRNVAAMLSFAANVLPNVLTAYRQRYPKVDVAVLDVIQVLGIGFEPESAGELHLVPCCRSFRCGAAASQLIQRAPSDGLAPTTRTL